ncbi:hypothetical protein HID58_011275, partial [Brassica napus]
FFEMEDGNRSFTVDEALVEMGFGKFQLYVLAYAGMGMVAEAMEMMLLSFVGPAVQSLWNLSSREESSITSVVFAGMLIGAYSWGIVADKHGRSWFLERICTKLHVVDRSPLFRWSRIGRRSCSRFWTVGTILEASLAWLIMPSLGWRWLLALSSIPSSLLLMFYKWTPESPRYLILQGRKAEALSILEKIARTNGTQLPKGVLGSEMETEMEETKSHPTESTHLLKPGELEEAPPPVSKMILKPDSKGPLLVLLSPELIKRTLLLWVVFFGNAFAYYGVVLLTTELKISQNKFPGLLISAAMVDRLGRKASMSSMLFTCCIFLLPLLTHQSPTLTTALLFGGRICISSAFTVVYIYAPEIYPTAVRTTGVGVGSSVGRIGGVLCPLVAVGLVHGCHQTIAVLLFEFVILVSGICVCLFPFETSGRELTDTISTSNEPSSSSQHEEPNNHDFVTDYNDAKLFIIKSYSEDNVHKSIKYKVWASTANGNKKLDAAYREAKDEKEQPCLVFLVFSVNASSQFCGVAEMIGPVDFDKSVEYWQQDKWSGQFPVKWHIIKSVPNSQFRHIILGNNEDKPVKLEQGIEMLKIFKNYDGETSILDNFVFYEEREKVIQERKARRQPSLPSAVGETEYKPASAALMTEFIKNMSKSFAQVVHLEEGSKASTDATTTTIAVSSGHSKGLIDEEDDDVMKDTI